MRLGSRVDEYFETGLRRVCNIPIAFQHFFFDIVVRQVNEMTRGIAVKLGGENGEGWEIKQVLYADDRMLVPKTRVYTLYCE